MTRDEKRALFEQYEARDRKASRQYHAGQAAYLAGEAERLEEKARELEEAGDAAAATERRGTALACRNSAELFADAAEKSHFAMTVTVLTRPPRKQEATPSSRMPQTVTTPRDRCRLRTNGERRRRSGRVRCGCSPGREGDPEPDVDAAVALVLLLAGLGLPPNPPSGQRIAFDTFRPGWPSAVRSVLFGLLPDTVQQGYWDDLGRHLEAA